jgi:hypothetical protein
MIKVESSPQRLILQSGSTSITLDKNTRTAVLQRKLLFWTRKPTQRPLTVIARARVEASTDPASGAEICSAMFALHGGGAWMLSAQSKQDATAAVDAVREFLGLPS